MPLPFAIAPIVQGLPSSSKRTAMLFCTVSVVMIACAAASAPSAESPLTSACIPFSIGVRSMGCPITPVDATMTSFAGIPVKRDVRSHMAAAFSTPSALQVLAIPLLQITARALPFFKCSRVTVMGAPQTRFCV